jgi:hypothetical protein
MSRIGRGLTLVVGGAVLVAPSATAQWRAAAMARATAVVVRADPAPYRDADTEAYLTQPIAMLRLDHGKVWRAQAALDFESLTLPSGELSPGAWGEGYVDRRHPHTTVHELMLSGRDLLGRHDGAGTLGVMLGKGFVPFGSDDPMSRPFSSFPVNHHLAQVLERAVAGVQYGWGPVAVEAALFNGDEPERPGQWPLLRQDGAWRFGDSWSARLLWTPRRELELQGSVASVHSPEHRQGAGDDQQKLATAARWQDDRRYGLIEYARTSELGGLFVFESTLAEVGFRRGEVGVAYRWERTDRPEEERPDDPYHTRRPHLENGILGVFRWTLHTLRVDRRVTLGDGPVVVTPFVEATLGRIALQTRGAVTPEGIYGTNTVRHLRLGVTVGWRDGEHRMGRYGILDPVTTSHHH